MATRYYLCEIVGDPALMLFPVFETLLPGVGYNAVDGRQDSAVGSGWMMVQGEVTDAEHSILAADSRVIVIPLEDNAGAALSLDQTVGDIPLAKRQTMQARLEAQHCPTSDFTLQTPIRHVLRRFVRRLKLRNAWLQNLDYTEAHSTLISAIPATRRNNIRNRLIANGYDVSGIALGDTVGAAIVKLLVQDVPANATGFD